MKYEMIFGDEKLFDGAPDHVEVLRFNDYSKEYLWGDLNTVKLLTFKELKAIPIVAMRRIIKTPVWTMGDQEVGRLPEVGCLVATIPNFDCTVVGVDEERKNIAIQYESGKLDVVRVHCVSPIESPEEKAARLKSEWAKNANELLFKRCSSTTLTEYLRVIHDAMLSGELPVPVAPEQNK